ncbi:DUF4357 domain-containing protein [Gemella cuniculi]|uniref:DUF4357 domain-containing protein n=1 Tax=Gemella cuniculi TaxID=150240 RepID=UPI0004199EEA|nr:DUF4357 domain-containing protein [Gemella cuniculi]
MTKGKNIIKNSVLMSNQLLSSSSYAGAFVLGGYTNGKVDRKNKNGITLKEIEESELLGMK